MKAHKTYDLKNLSGTFTIKKNRGVKGKNPIGKFFIFYYLNNSNEFLIL